MLKKKIFFKLKSLKRDLWLEKIIKKNCYLTTDHRKVKFFQEYENSFISLKSKKKIEKKFLANRKLKFIGINKSFQKNINSGISYLKKKKISYKLRLNNNEKKKVMDISYDNFNHSRFHLDKRLSKTKSNLIKKKTLQNFFLGFRSNKIIVQFYRKKISGFCLLKYENSFHARIDLVCIDKKFTGKKLATDLINYTLNYLKKNNKNRLTTSTQEKNLVAIKLYNSLKFIPKSRFFLYHYIS